MTKKNDNVALVTELTIAWLANPNTRATADDVPGFLAGIHASIEKLDTVGAADTGTTETVAEYTPAVGVRKSLSDPEFIISLIDGKPYRTLKRHLSSHGLTMEQYRERYSLKADYPSIAPAYREARSATAKRLGLGRKPGLKAASKTVEVVPAPKGRKGIAEAKAAAKAYLEG